MTNITPVDFDTQTTAVMTEIATLLRAAQEVHGMSISFKNSPELDKRAATPFAKDVTKFTAEAGAALLIELFGPLSRRDSGLSAVRQHYKFRLKGAIDSAQKLAEMEEQGMLVAGVKVNVIRLKVLEPLQHFNW